MGRNENEDEAKAAEQRLADLPLSSKSGAERGELIVLISGFIRGQFSGDSKLQSVAQEDRWRWYWEKLVSRAGTTEKCTDQLILRHLGAYLRSGDSKEIITNIIDTDHYENVFEHFAGWLSDDWMKLSKLYADLIDRDIENIKRTGKFVEGKSYLPLWRLWLRENACYRNHDDQDDPVYAGFIACPRAIPNRKNGGNVLAWVSGRIEAALQVSIAEVNELYYYHSGSPGGTSFLSSPHVAQLRRAIVDYIRAHGNTPDWWVDRLQPGQPYTLYHLFFHVAGRDQAPTIHKPSDWSWTIPVLIEACKKKWTVIAPMMLFLVSKSYETTNEEGVHISGNTFELTRGLEFCDDDSALLRALLRTLTGQPESTIDLPPRERLGCEEIMRGIRDYLASEDKIS